MKGWLAVVSALLAVLLTPAAQGAPEITVLLHHPNDGVDPFGFPYSPAGDYFQDRYSSLVADKQRFDFPFFVADGVLPLEKIPDPSIPFESARAAYEQTVAQRLAEETPATLRLASTRTAASALVSVAIEPRAPIEGENLHLLLAITEDPVHFLPPPGLTNGVTEHRFTVRAIVDLGRIDLEESFNVTRAIPLDPSWMQQNLHVAAWLQQSAASPRFDAREVAQATSSPLGSSVVQESKGVLVEMLSATWCEPCLYGDLAVEAVAVAHGSAQPLQTDSGPRYFQGPPSLPVAITAAVLAALVVAVWGGRP